MNNKSNEIDFLTTGLGIIILTGGLILIAIFAPAFIAALRA